MVDQPLGPDKLGNYATHKSIGLLIFSVTALRLAWRLTHPAPPLPAGTPGWQRFVARLTQVLLYALMFLMPLTGLLRSQAANFPVSFFGLFTVPTIVGVNDEFSKGMAAAHEMQGTILLVLDQRPRPGRPSSPLRPQGRGAAVDAAARGARLGLEQVWLAAVGAASAATLLILVAAEAAPTGATTRYELEPAGSSLTFTAIQQGAKFESRFDRFTAEVRFDPATPEAGSITSRIDLGSVDTGNPERDEVLKGADWFNLGTVARGGLHRRAHRPGRRRLPGQWHPDAPGCHGPRQPPLPLDTRRPPGQAARLVGSATLERLAFGVGQGDWRDTDLRGQPGGRPGGHPACAQAQVSDKSVSIKGSSSTMPGKTLQIKALDGHDPGRLPGLAPGRAEGRAAGAPGDFRGHRPHAAGHRRVRRPGVPGPGASPLRPPETGHRTALHPDRRRPDA